MNHKSLMVAGGLVVTAVVTAIALALIDVHAEFALYSINVWFIVPVGAIGCGLLVGGGYYAMARLLHYRPSQVEVVVPALAGVATYFLTFYLVYRMVDFGGVPLSRFIGFGEFFQLSLENTSMTVGRSGNGSTGELGSAGYGLGAIQALGFGAGGVIVHRYLRSLPFCDTCERYLSKTQGTTSWFSGETDMAPVMQSAHERLGAADRPGLHAVLASGGDVPRKQRKIQAVCNEHVCSSCGAGRVMVQFNAMGKNNQMKPLAPLMVQTVPGTAPAAATAQAPGSAADAMVR